MTAYGADQGASAGPEHPEHPEEPVEIPANTPPPAPAVASTKPILKVAPSAPQVTPSTPPVIPPYPSHLLHLSQGLLYPLSRADYRHSDPVHCHPEAPPFVDQPMPPEEPITGETGAVEPSSPHHPSATI
ncbi:hypothetical protein CK203_111806 [Vitis vinifera]|uniref:Uncharacterized protein n=1 Tax=Vitis vinifera TaxID=29760 RepID=A0A438FKE2_VITVI|nr:hypothetical protein CK203_111806 [Vitis vinifera]